MIAHAFKLGGPQCFNAYCKQNQLMLVVANWHAALPCGAYSTSDLERAGGKKA